MKPTRRSPRRPQTQDGCLITLLKLALLLGGLAIGVVLVGMVAALAWPLVIVAIILILPKPKNLFGKGRK